MCKMNDTTLANRTSPALKTEQDAHLIYVVLILIFVQSIIVLICITIYYKIKIHKLRTKNEQEHLESIQNKMTVMYF